MKIDFSSFIKMIIQSMVSNADSEFKKNDGADLQSMIRLKLIEFY
jgi:hypothetical protein